ncbi:hypothetical protein Gotur_018794 [Gossypium turneri]
MDLTLAKSQGYLKHQLPQSESYSQRKLLAIIGVYTRFGSYLKRNTLEVLGCLEFHSFAIMQLVGTNGINYFEIGSANRGDSLDCHIDEENSKMKDFFILNTVRNMSSLKDVVGAEEVKSSDEKLSEDEYVASKDEEITGKIDL